MAQIIYNTSQVTDNSTQPPIVVTSNQVQTAIRVPIPPITPVRCIDVFICQEECNCRQNSCDSHNDCSNFPKPFFDQQTFCCQDRECRNSPRRRTNERPNNHKNRCCLCNIFRIFC